MNENPDLSDVARRELREQSLNNVGGDFRIRKKRFARWRPLMLVLVPGLLIAIAMSLLTKSTATGDFIGGTLLFSTLAGVLIGVLYYGDRVKAPVGINGTQSDIVVTEKRQTRMVHVLASMVALVVPILLIMLDRFFTDHELGARNVGFICLGWLFFSFREQVYQLGNWIEKQFGRSGPDTQSAPSLAKDLDRIDFSSLAVNVFAFLAVTLMIVLTAKGFGAWRLTQSMPNAAPVRRSTTAYWQSAVANLHVVRFETPSGQESAEQYYERLIQQIRQKRDSARAMSTANVDVDLVQMANRHLEVEDLFIDYKQQVDEYMKNEKLARPADTIEQRMALSQLILSSIQAAPNALNSMPPGPIRDLIEKGVILEQAREVQLREIEIMQAVLQERYRGTKFPLPAVAN